MLDRFNLKIFCIIFISLEIGCKGKQSESTVKYEADQHSVVHYNLDELKDSTDELNKVINFGLQKAIQEWEPSQSREAFIENFVSLFSTRQIETWVIDNPKISSMLPELDYSIYQNTPDTQSDSLTEKLIKYPFIFISQTLKSPIISVKGLAANLKVNDIIIGSDKLTHFFSLGNLYLKKYNQSIKNSLSKINVIRIENLDMAKRQEIEEIAIKEAIAYGVSTEEGQWGRATTGVFSNADLAANYDGFMMFLKIIRNQSELIGWDESNAPYMKKMFDLRDYVTLYWNEVINPNTYSLILSKSVPSVLYTYCFEYKKNPLLFSSNEVEKYENQYRSAGLELLEKRNQFKMENICNDFEKKSVEEKSKYVQIDSSKDLRKISTYNKKTRGITIRDSSGNFVQEKTKIKEYLKLHGSSIPGCKSHLESAIEEHDAILLKHAQTRFEMSKILAGEMTDLPRAVNLNVRNQYQCREVDVNSSNIRPTISLKIRYCKREDNLIDYEYLVSYKNSTEQALIDLFGPLESIIDGEFKGSSLRGFFNFEDLVGYVYRTIPLRCKWY